MAVDLEEIKARLFARIEDETIFCKWIKQDIQTLCDEVETLRAELAEHRASLKAKEETINYTEPRRHLP